jgi:HD-GYP domain-containing protein (c-di-GMP phosphodiesterase class II)
MDTAFTAAPNRFVDAHETTLERWVRALEVEDLETEGHTFRVTGMAIRLATAIGLSGEALLNVRRGALLHDVGKLGIPRSILHKKGRLSEAEMAIVRMHPQNAYDMLTRIDFPPQALEIPYCHHERWDGTGYPRRLKGRQIPLSARLFAVVDVYDALTTNRSYRAAMPFEDVVVFLRYQRGRQFDWKIVDAFLNLLTIS